MKLAPAADTYHAEPNSDALAHALDRVINRWICLLWAPLSEIGFSVAVTSMQVRFWHNPLPL